MDKIYFKDHRYIEETGQSTVWLNYHGKTYRGDAKLHPDDKEHASNIFGGRLAEERATLKIYKHERNELKNKYKIIKAFVVNTQSTTGFSKMSKENFLLEEQLYKMDKQIKKVEKEIENTEKYIKKMVNFRSYFTTERKERTDRINAMRAKINKNIERKKK